MSPTYHTDIQQGTPEWYALRAGTWSSSKAAVIMGGLDTKGLDDLIQTIAWERVYGPVERGFHSKAMDRGHVLEPEARDWFAFARNAVVETVGFVSHATLPNVGWSADGLFGNRRYGIEAKCPLHKAYMEILRTRRVPAEYRWQCRWAHWVGQLDGVFFVGYHPGPGGIVIPFEATSTECEQMEERVHHLEQRVKPWVDMLMEQRA